MGEMADDLIDGYSCSHCGIYFEEAHGFPVLCESCFKEDKGWSNIPQSTHKELA